MLPTARSCRRSWRLAVGPMPDDAIKSVHGVVILPLPPYVIRLDAIPPAESATGVDLQISGRSQGSPSSQAPKLPPIPPGTRVARSDAANLSVCSLILATILCNIIACDPTPHSPRPTSYSSSAKRRGRNPGRSLPVSCTTSANATLLDEGLVRSWAAAGIGVNNVKLHPGLLPVEEEGVEPYLPPGAAAQRRHGEPPPPPGRLCSANRGLLPAAAVVLGGLAQGIQGAHPIVHPRVRAGTAR